MIKGSSRNIVRLLTFLPGKIIIKGSTRNIVRLLTFLPGKILFDISDWTTKHFYQCGQFVSR